MKKLILLFTLTFISQSAICQKSESYFPMAVGNSWEYDWYYGLGGHYIERDTIVSKVLKPNGKHYYTFQILSIRDGYSNPFDGGSVNLRMDDSSNVYGYYGAHESYNIEILLYKFNTTIGEIWSSGKSLYSVLGFSDVPVHAFLWTGSSTYIENKVRKTLQIAINSGMDVRTMAFAEGIGLYSITGGTQHSRMEFNKAHIVLDVKEHQKNNIPESFSLFCNYPNPFNPETTIKLVLKDKAHATLDIYNILGRKIRSLHKGFLSSGEHRFFWNGKDEMNINIPSGVYYCYLNLSDEHVKIIGKDRIKLMLLR